MERSIFGVRAQFESPPQHVTLHRAQLSMRSRLSALGSISKVANGVPTEQLTPDLLEAAKMERSISSVRSFDSNRCLGV